MASRLARRTTARDGWLSRGGRRDYNKPKPRRWQCRTTHTLVLDDLGSGARERESQFWLAWLDDVIGSRANDAKRTIITTNRSLAELAPWLGARLIDRLKAGTIVSTSDKSMRGKPTNPMESVTQPMAVNQNRERKT